jgi:hypothetical protein
LQNHAKGSNHKYLVPTISNEFAVLIVERFGSVQTLTIEGRTWIVLGGSYKIWIQKTKKGTQNKKKKKETRSRQ